MKINQLVFKGILFLNIFTFTTTMSAQEKKLFSLEDLNYGGVNYYNMTPKNMHTAWWGEKLIHTDVEQCSIIDTKTGKEKVLFTLDQINKWAGSDDNHYVRHLQNATFPYPDKPIVALGNKKAFILLDFKTKQVVWQDSISGQEANEWNPVSKATVYVKDNQLAVADANGMERILTTDGSHDIVYGQAVHRNEFGIEKGTFWSPDGQRLAFYRMDQSMVPDYPQVDIEARIAKHEPDKYPMAGENTHIVTIGVYDTQTGKTIYLKTPITKEDPLAIAADLNSPVPVYYSNITWSPDSKTIYLFELNRDQNDCRLVSYDAETGERLQELYHETNEKYVEPENPLLFLPWDSSKALMQSQKDGYKHLYLVEGRESRVEGRESLNIRQLTSGEWVVMEVLGFNTKDKSVIIRSNELSPIQANIFAVDIATGKRTLLDNGRGYHYGTLSANGTLVLDRYSEPTVPRCINVTPTTGIKGKNDATALSSQKEPGVRILTADDPWEGYQQPGFICGTIKAADGVTDLYYRLVVPAELYEKMDKEESLSTLNSQPSTLHSPLSTKKYPTVVYVYGGPHAHNVNASWHYWSRSWETYMAQKGYIIFILDNRGSENRGRAFEQATFRQLGQVEMEDQMKGVEFIKSLPYVDTDRIGVHGWSFGGFMTISLITNYPDVFKVGVAGGPVIDWRLYEVMYGERYMDTPQQNPEGYAKTSLINKAKDLKGKLQIITGYNDATVVPQNCLAFLAECIKEGTQPDFFVYPGEPHNMRGHQSVHLHERITQYFEDYLK